MGGGKATTHVPWWKVDTFVGSTRGRRTFVNLLGTRSRSLKHTTVPLPLFTQIHKQIKWKKTTEIQYRHYSIFSLPFHCPFERQDNSMKLKSGSWGTSYRPPACSLSSHTRNHAKGYVLHLVHGGVGSLTRPCSNVFLHSFFSSLSSCLSSFQSSGVWTV